MIAPRNDRTALTREDARPARSKVELRLPEELDAPAHELETIATHEAGHATVDYLIGSGCKVLSIIKRREVNRNVPDALLERQGLRDHQTLEVIHAAGGKHLLENLTSA